MKEGDSDGIDLLQFPGATATLLSPFIPKELNNAKGDDSAIVEFNGTDDNDAADKQV